MTFKNKSKILKVSHSSYIFSYKSKLRYFQAIVAKYKQYSFSHSTKIFRTNVLKMSLEFSDIHTDMKD